MFQKLFFFFFLHFIKNYLGFKVSVSFTVLLNPSSQFTGPLNSKQIQASF